MKGVGSPKRNSGKQKALRFSVDFGRHLSAVEESAVEVVDHGAIKARNLLFGKLALSLPARDRGSHLGDRQVGDKKVPPANEALLDGRAFGLAHINLGEGAGIEIKK